MMPPRATKNCAALPQPPWMAPQEMAEHRQARWKNREPKFIETG